VSAETSATSVERARLRMRNLRTLALLAALFFLPLLLAFITYYGSPWRPARHVNHGLLISPPVVLPQVLVPDPWHGHWSLVYIGAGGATPPAARRCGSCARRAWRSAPT